VCRRALGGQPRGRTGRLIAPVEDLIQALIYHRAREILGLPACPMHRPGRARPAVLAGSPRTLN
jgi:hypothetical protein